MRRGPRFIPACAGNRCRDRRSAVSGAVHPRVCGEQLTRPASVDAVPRFIPACAGNRPHDLLLGRFALGSSPRVRGTGWASPTRGRQRRFIPACAGNSPSLCCAPGPSPVHPRVCGEQVFVVMMFLLFAGSSPRVRGTDKTSCVTQGPCRFIPACAGNSWRYRRTSRWLAVHPRVCGEQSTTRLATMLEFGSSPRVRGTAARVALLAFLGRFIPACAGNSRQSKD